MMIHFLRNFGDPIYESYSRGKFIETEILEKTMIDVIMTPTIHAFQCLLNSIVAQ
jgi:hypothetical protein